MTQKLSGSPDGTEKRDYVLVEAEGMDGAATAVELYLGSDGWMLGRVMH